MAKVMDDIDFFLAMVNGEIEEPKTEMADRWGKSGTVWQFRITRQSVMCL